MSASYHVQSPGELLTGIWNDVHTYQAEHRHKAKLKTTRQTLINLRDILDNQLVMFESLPFDRCGDDRDAYTADFFLNHFESLAEIAPDFAEMGYYHHLRGRATRKGVANIALMDQMAHTSDPAAVAESFQKALDRLLPSQISRISAMRAGFDQNRTLSERDENRRNLPPYLENQSLRRTRRQMTLAICDTLALERRHAARMASELTSHWNRKLSQLHKNPAFWREALADPILAEIAREREKSELLRRHPQGTLKQMSHWLRLAERQWLDLSASYPLPAREALADLDALLKAIQKMRGGLAWLRGHHAALLRDSDLARALEAHHTPADNQTE